MSFVMQINILSIFPEYFKSALDQSIIKRAIGAGVISVNVVDIRSFASDKHKTTDDRPFGGGAGMVMKIEPIDRALKSLNLTKSNNCKIILMSARGKQFTQNIARDFSKLSTLTIICGHYGDVDQRVADHLADAEISIGEYVLTGGEPAALVVVDAITRLLPKVLGNSDSLEAETHGRAGFISPPQYTRPANYKGWTIPQVLLSGDPVKIKNWQTSRQK